MTNAVTALLFLSVLMGIGGCRRQVPVTTPTSLPTQRPSADPSVSTRPGTGVSQADSGTNTTSFTSARQANIADVTFTYLTTRSKLAFKSPQQEIDNASLSIRVQKDSLIWLSVSKLGIEAVRVLISRDSIRILDKINHQYAVADYTTLSRQFNFRMDFALIQAMLVGNLPRPDLSAQAVRSEQDYLLLRQTEGSTLFDNYISEQNRKLSRLLVTEQPANNTLKIEYQDFTALNAFLFPYTDQIALVYRSIANSQPIETQLTIRHSRVELVSENPGFPFSIPASYQRRP